MLTLKDENMLSEKAQQFIRSVGNTPLIKVGEKLYAKLETANPTGSIKDRMISYVVEQAALDGKIKPSTLLVEATSGNTGIALAALGAAMNNPVQIIMPCNMSEERKQMMRAFGASIVEVAASDFEAAINRRSEILLNVEDSWSPLQLEIKVINRCHKHKTGPEIFKQLPAVGDWSAFIS